MATDKQLVQEFISTGYAELGYDKEKLSEFTELSLLKHKRQLAVEQEHEREKE